MTTVVVVSMCPFVVAFINDLEVEDASVLRGEALPGRNHPVQDLGVQSQRGDGSQQPAVTCQTHRRSHDHTWTPGLVRSSHPWKDKAALTQCSLTDVGSVGSIDDELRIRTQLLIGQDDRWLLTFIITVKIKHSSEMESVCSNGLHA